MLDLSRLLSRRFALGICFLLTGSSVWCNAETVSRCQADIPGTSTVRIFKEKCYNFIKDEKYWTTARDFCAQYGGRLVKNDDEETNQFLTTTLNEMTWWKNDGVWIGLNDRKMEFQWEWTTGKQDGGEPVSWTNWASGHPASYLNTHRDCVRMRRYNGKWLWVETPCQLMRWHYRFICEYSIYDSSAVNSAEELQGTAMVYFSIFGIAAVTICSTGTIVGLIVYNIFCVKRRRELLRRRFRRGQNGAAAGRALPNTYVKMEDILSQQRLQNPSSSPNANGDSAIYSEVHIYCEMKELTSNAEHQTHVTGYLPMTQINGAGVYTNQPTGRSTENLNGSEYIDLQASQPVTDSYSMAMYALPRATNPSSDSNACENADRNEVGCDVDMSSDEVSALKQQSNVNCELEEETNDLLRSQYRQDIQNMYPEVTSDDSDTNHIYECVDDLRAVTRV